MENTFLEEIRKLNENEFKREIYIPSFEKNFLIKPFLGKHQRKIIESGLDNPLYSAIFHINCFEIIEELIGDKAISDNITVFDKNAILIQIKYHFIDGDGLDDAIEFIKNMKVELNPVVFNVDGFKVTLNTPKAIDEYNLYKEFTKSIGYDLEVTDNNQLRTMISNIYMLELCKYVSILSIVDKELSLNFNSLKIEDRIETLDTLGKRVNTEITNNIIKIKEKYNSMLKMGDKDFDINVEFFN